MSASPSHRSAARGVARAAARAAQARRARQPRRRLPRDDDEGDRRRRWPRSRGAARGSGGAADHAADRLSSAGLARLPRSGAYYASSREVLISLAVPRGAAVDGDGEETRASGTPSSDGVPQSSSPSASACAAAVAVAAAEDDDDDETLVSLLLLPFSRKSKSHARPLPRADVVLSRIPPLGGLDRALTGAHIGCGRLRSRFAAWAAPPRLWCFGHVHESYGAERAVLRKPSKGATDGSGGDAATDPPTAGGRAADAATSWAPSTTLCLNVANANDGMAKRVQYNRPPMVTRLILPKGADGGR